MENTNQSANVKEDGSEKVEEEVNMIEGFFSLLVLVGLIFLVWSAISYYTRSDSQTVRCESTKMGYRLAKGMFGMPENKVNDVKDQMLSECTYIESAWVLIKSR